MNHFDSPINSQWLLDGSLRTKAMALSIGTVIHQIHEKTIDIKPSFKHRSKWSIPWASQIVESMLIGIPMQKIFCEEGRHGQLTILDGSHILDSVYRYSNSQFALKELSLRKDLNGRFINEMNFRDYNLLMERFNLDFSIISYDTPAILKCEFYKRLNRTNTRFPMQSARDYAFPRMSDFIEKSKSKSKGFIKFSLVRSNAGRDLFKAESDINQFFLYLFTLTLVHFNMFVVDDSSVGEILDRAGEYINNSSGVHGIEDYVVKTLSMVGDRLSFESSITISKTKEGSREFEDETIYADEEDGLSMEVVLYAFQRVLKSDFNISDFSKPYLIPHFWDHKKSFKALM